MRLRELRLRNFRRFADHALAFAPGLTIVVGSNETGKSTVVAALGAALFADVTSKARSVAALERWGSRGAMSLTLSFDHAGDLYTLVKDFGARRVTLTNDTTGETLGDRAEIDRRVTAAVGFATREAFESVASVRQGEIAILMGKGGESRRNKLVPMIERKITSGGGSVAAPSVLDALDRHVAAIRVGLDRPAKNPGLLKTLVDRRDALARSIGEGEAAWREATTAREELGRDREELRESTSTRDALARTVERETARSERRSELARIADELARNDGLTADILKLSADLDAGQEALLATSPEAERGVLAASAAREAADARVTDLEASAPPGVEPGAGRGAAAAGWALAALAVALIVAPLTGLLAETLTPWLAAAAACAAGGAAAFFRRSAVHGALARALERETDARNESEEALARALGAVGVRSRDEFERRLTANETLRNDVAGWEARLEEKCEGGNPGDFGRRLRTDAVRLSRERELASQALEELGGSEGALGATELAKLREERDALDRRIADLERRTDRAVDRLADSDVGEALPDMVARLEGVEAEIEEVERQLKVAAIARDGIGEALARTKEEAASALEPVVSRVLGRVTDGRYESVRVGHDLTMSPANPDPGAGAPESLSADDLSAGTVDQLYLAVRFALLEFLSAADGPPLILDDALVHFDRDRRLAAAPGGGVRLRRRGRRPRRQRGRAAAACGR